MSHLLHNLPYFYPYFFQVHELRKTAGRDLPATVHNALRMMMTKRLMSKFNKQGLGTKGKRALKDTNIYKLIVGKYSLPI